MCRKKNNILLLFILACIVVGLLTSLLPFSDIDNDGALDSLVTEGFVLTPMLLAGIGMFLLRTELPSAHLVTPRHFSFLLFSPPIFN